MEAGTQTKKNREKRKEKENFTKTSKKGGRRGGQVLLQQDGTWRNWVGWGDYFFY